MKADYAQKLTPGMKLQTRAQIGRNFRAYVAKRKTAHSHLLNRLTIKTTCQLSVSSSQVLVYLTMVFVEQFKKLAKN